MGETERSKGTRNHGRSPMGQMKVKNENEDNDENECASNAKN